MSPLQLGKNINIFSKLKTTPERPWGQSEFPRIPQHDVMISTERNPFLEGSVYSLVVND